MPRDANHPGWIRTPRNLYVPLPAGTGAAEIVTDWVAAYRYYIESVKAYTAVVSTGAGATRTLRVLRTNGSTDVTVASATVTLAGTDTLGEEVTFSLTAANTEFGDSSKLTVDFASGGTAFTAGALNLIIVLRKRAQQLG